MEYDKLSELAQRVITGKATIARLDKDEEQGRISGGRRNVEATIVLGASLDYNQSQQQGCGWAINQHILQIRIQIVITSFATCILKT